MASSGWPTWSIWPGSTVFFATVPVERGDDAGLRELELGRRQLGLGLLHARAGAAGGRLFDRDLRLLGRGVRHQGLGLLDPALGLLDGERAPARLDGRRVGVALGLAEAAARGLERGQRRPGARAGDVVLLGRDQPLGRQPAGPLEIEPGAVRGRLGEDDLGLGGGHRGAPALGAGPRLVGLGAADVHGRARGGRRGARLLESALRALPGEGNLRARAARLRGGHAERGARLIDADLVVPRVDLDQELSRPDVLVVPHVDAGHRTGDAGADRHDGPLDVGVVGGDTVTGIHPGPPAVGDGGEDRQRDREGQETARHHAA